MNDLKGKNIIVTGASGGIGKSIIEKLNNAGANIVASGTKKEKLDDIFLIISLWARAENSSPPYFLGIIKPKNFSFFKYAHTSFENSFFWYTSQSFTISHKVSVGPFKKACSSFDRTVPFCFIIFLMFGFPENSSVSIHVEPASIAVFSV